jgi:hypothetical protein
MQDYDVQKHKGHLIYAAATPAGDNKRWHAEGIVFSVDFPKRVEEIHYMKSKSDFPTEKQARDYAISLCKIWIDLGDGRKIRRQFKGPGSRGSAPFAMHYLHAG